MTRSLIYCMVTLDDEYDYDNNATVCSNPDTLLFWVKCGINRVVVLDGFSMEVITTLSDSNQIEEYVWDNCTLPE